MAAGGGAVDGPVVVPSVAGRDAVMTLVTVIMVVVVGLTFAFGFGNVFQLGLRPGVPVWAAPLVAPAVDLSVVGLLLGTRQLAVQGAPAELLHPARRLLVFSSVVTLALNVAEPVIAGDYGKAAFDAVGPALLIGLRWARGCCARCATPPPSTPQPRTSRSLNPRPGRRPVRQRCPPPCLHHPEARARGPRWWPFLRSAIPTGRAPSCSMVRWWSGRGVRMPATGRNTAGRSPRTSCASG